MKHVRKIDSENNLIHGSGYIMSKIPDSDDNTTVFEYIEKNICYPWGIDNLSTEFEEIRLIKTSFPSKITTISVNNDTIDEGYLYPAEEHVQLEFYGNGEHYVLDIKVRYGGGTPECCATYFFTYNLVSG